MDVRTSVFTAPMAGLYHFPESIANYTNAAITLLKVNGKSKLAVYIPSSKEYEEHSSKNDGSSVSFDSLLLKLKVGDHQIKLSLSLTLDREYRDL